ncbi:DNA polymerase-3 subunit delta' [Kineococcus xinjiangensis]|uniref:DNA polymerase-3 subunit delta n=1 Tax=Kineococcus xinjiangensis TaxID=512762 RepID=A0A2S6IFF2_9ACTN|nr:DNA polymerase III subunit delta' [Kineococcus xinjiangensis]PPK92944.1 DNA polymerase-3 subunit delta' [Kineococcus xinjiangensis]
MSAAATAEPQGVWRDVVGQGPAVAVLAAAAAAARSRLARGGGTTQAAAAGAEAAGMTHAWLLTGPPGSGRSTAARAFAAALHCEDDTAPPGCGRCSGCRTALAGTHADVDVFATEHTQIRREDVEPLIAVAHRRPSLGRWRVVVVEDADRLNETSGNTLLKSIEEPPEQTVWLLCAPNVDDVLRTIRSRCRHVPLRVPPASAVAELLQRRDGVDPAMAEFAARAAQSHIGFARRLARDEGARIRRRDVLRLPSRADGVGRAVIAAGELVEVAQEEAKAATAERDATERAALMRALGAEGSATPPPAVRAQVRQLEDDQKRRARRSQTDALDRALVDLLGLFRDVLVVQLGAAVELVNGDQRAEVERLARASSAEDTMRRIDAIRTARTRLAGNVAPLLAVEAMALEFVPARPGPRGDR